MLSSERTHIQGRDNLSRDMLKFSASRSHAGNLVVPAGSSGLELSWDSAQDCGLEPGDSSCSSDSTDCQRVPDFGRVFSHHEAGSSDCVYKRELMCQKGLKRQEGTQDMSFEDWRDTDDTVRNALPESAYSDMRNALADSLNNSPPIPVQGVKRVADSELGLKLSKSCPPGPDLFSRSTSSIPMHDTASDESSDQEGGWSTTQEETSEGETEESAGLQPLMERRRKGPGLTKNGGRESSLSRWYNGKAKSFTSLADCYSMSSAQGLRKPKGCGKRRRKHWPLAENLQASYSKLGYIGPCDILNCGKTIFEEV